MDTFAPTQLDQSGRDQDGLPVGLPAPTTIHPTRSRAQPRTDGPSGFGRIDVGRAAAGLRHIDPSAEPAMVFSHLAAVCVPAVCDEIIIDLVENGHGYRIRRPAADPTAARTPRSASGDALRSVLRSGDSVTVAVRPAPSLADGALFSGSVVCRWTDGYLPTATDASLLHLMVDHAVALVHREQSSGTLHRLQTGSEKLHTTLSRNRRIASAVGVVMALHHVDQAQAMGLLIRIGEWSRVDLHDLADTVVTTRCLPTAGKPGSTR